MIHFHAVGHVANTGSIILVLIADKAHFMAAFNQALTELVAVGLHATKLREGKVSANQDGVLLVSLSSPGAHCL